MAKKKKKVTTIVTTTVTEEVINVPSNERTHIICILDRSGSMSSIMNDSIGGFNEFLRKQKELPDRATITVNLFDDKHDCPYDFVDIKDAKELTRDIWYPRGTTALYDAIGRAINKEKARFASLASFGSEIPAKVLVCIVTDGLNNASKEYTREDIQSLIKKCENDDWNFIYLAANQNAFAVGQSFGISYANTYCYVANSVGVAGMSATLNNATTSYRNMSSTNGDFKKMSKSLINDPNGDPDYKDKNDPNNNGNISVNDAGMSGTITTNGNKNNITFTNLNTTAEVKDLK
jgi:uncharacterized protein YegL